MPKNLLVTIDTPAKPFGDRKRQSKQNYEKVTHQLVSADGTQIPISDDVFKVLLEIVPILEQGQATVTISPNSAEISTQQAADILNVSRPHLVKLLDNNEIPHTKTGTHRRIKVKDLMDYKEKKDTQCRQSLREMVEIMQETGLY
ncbi:helix-turn-helix domain-containing protein [Aetokthonos hydrillicola Thurmond2011]|jgi:excisionase family DNA binding protein|uniref:Helix-turn-helix domain-containing protein n=1 Tax=Aetokthonos hydrillicola Thurmond2011 TaxID=2712845 RepID=A0AAP5I406_9CYAN|nr:helix-turn-helix domain-containing protein [Aetokthonos hydrillicola]MBO3462678.1 helix-turn-helix domain-containing protein [Aetokthonos hydrillicola CCALA 1050]MBW4588049.1 helix-turn-helix domain-containing protein [Aetokthonos hydrillicola CCALA 1050]MDR9893364.1 helix-turn-helix domain-containing protein [Aetokthonos hydrillicola Thurmond2011]